MLNIMFAEHFQIININTITRGNAMFRSISPCQGYFYAKCIPVGIEPTTETESLAFTLNYNAPAHKFSLFQVFWGFNHESACF